MLFWQVVAMETRSKIRKLERRLDEARNLKVRNSDDPAFKAWRDCAERDLVRIFGDDSTEVKQFRKLLFFHRSLIKTARNTSRDDSQAFERDLKLAMDSLARYLSGFRDESSLSLP